MEHPFLTDLVRLFTDPLQGHVVCPQHTHHFFQLDIILDGTNNVIFEHESPLPMRRGDAMLIPPLVSHGYESEGLVLQGAFKFHMAPHYWAAFGDRPIHITIDEALVSLVEDAVKRYRGGEQLAHERAIAVLMICLTEIAPHASHEKHIEEGLDLFRMRLWPVLEKVTRDPNSDWTVSRLAKACFFQVDYFSKCFHKVLRTTPQQYLLESRMRAAAEDLLFNPDLAIKEIAEKARYASIHSFTRAFTRVFGVGPAAYRRQTEHL